MNISKLTAFLLVVALVLAGGLSGYCFHEDALSILMATGAFGSLLAPFIALKLRLDLFPARAEISLGGIGFLGLFSPLAGHYFAGYQLNAYVVFALLWVMLVTPVILIRICDAGVYVPHMQLEPAT